MSRTFVFAAALALLASVPAQACITFNVDEAGHDALCDLLRKHSTATFTSTTSKEKARGNGGVYIYAPQTITVTAPPQPQITVNQQPQLIVAPPSSPLGSICRHYVIDGVYAGTTCEKLELDYE